jgi:hypothetical protein
MGDLRTEQFVSKIWSIWSGGLAQQSASEPAWKHGREMSRRLRGEASARAARRDVRRDALESCIVAICGVEVVRCEWSELRSALEDEDGFLSSLRLGCEGQRLIYVSVMSRNV